MYSFQLRCDPATLQPLLSLHSKSGRQLLFHLSRSRSEKNSFSKLHKFILNSKYKCLMRKVFISSIKTNISIHLYKTLNIDVLLCPSSAVVSLGRIRQETRAVRIDGDHLQSIESVNLLFECRHLPPSLSHLHFIPIVTQSRWGC